MNSESILKADVLDIVFEKRNKLYGAYTLRKFYKNRLFGALFITMVTVTVLSAFTFMPENPADFISSSEITMYKIAKPVVPIAKKEELKQSPKSPPKSQRKFLIPIIAAEKIKPDTIHEVKSSDIIGFKNINVPENDMPAILDNETASNGGEGKANTNISEKLTLLPIENPDVQAAYPGGISALKKFLERNLINPNEMEQGEMVAVNIKFVVGYDGKIQNFEVIKDGGDIYNKEVIRVLKKMPQWVPGKSNGQNVPVYFVIPIKFVPAN